MSVVVTAIVPVFLLIVLGAGLRRAGWPGDGFWAPAEGLTYFLLFPALLFRGLATADLRGVPIEPIAGVLVISALAMVAVLLALRRGLRTADAAFTSVVQGAVRFNTYLGVALTAALFGADGVTLAAIYLAIMVPLGNVICVGALAIYSGPSAGRGTNLTRIVVELARNPLVLACIAGIAVNLAGLPLPRWIDAFLAILADAALPLGLLCAGAGLDIRAARAAAPLIALACGLKLVVMPALTFGAAEIAGLAGLAATVVVLFNALPAAPTAFVLARQMGGDAELMAGILTAQTAAAVVTLPLLLAWLG